MPVESVFPQLEPLLPLVRKPVQYVGGEVNSTVKEWDEADVRWALLYPDAYEVGPAQPGHRDPLRGAERAARRARRAHLQRLARPRAAHAGARHPAVHRGRAPAGRRLRRARRSLLHRARLHQPADRARPGRNPAAVRGPDDRAPGRARRAATRRSTPSRSPTSSTRWSSATARRRCSPITAPRPRVEAVGCPGGRDGLLLSLAATGGVYVPRFYDVTLPARRPDRRVAPNRPGVPALGAQAHAARPRRLAVPEGAGRAGRGDRARAVQRGDLPRLHARLPVLPGRDDHPAGARAVDHHGRARWSSPGSQSTGFSEVGLLSLSSADHSEINEIAIDLADCYEGSNVGLSLPSTRVDAFNVTLADELSQERQALRADVRARGRLGADAQGDQQDGHRGRPDPHRDHRLLRRAGGR